MKLTDCSADEQEQLAMLEPRIGRLHLRQRLGLEGEHEARVVRRRTHFFHLENWYSIHGLIRGSLTVTGLRGRGQRNVLDIRVRHNTVRLRKLPSALDGYTLLQLSDLHLDMSAAHRDRLIEVVSGVQFDACVLTGDYRFQTFGPYQPALDALARLRPHLGASVYAVLGNHDTIRMVPGIEAMDMTVLLNESARIERDGQAFNLVGIDDAHYFRTHSFQKAAAGLDLDECAILLSHTPEPFRHAAHAGFCLMLSGHTHGGQICLPGGIPILTDCDAPRAFARGAWRYEEMAGYTSVGCGASIVDVRLNCPAEITLHRLRRA
ncbi:metallophosphoesterase [Piscinibacter sakaiensis]|uniref:metallophosphoesterase n=1 Tax=Piscinibacter sakaiensis TaxID=1547922 RepID=UPI003AAAAA17